MFFNISLANIQHISRLNCSFDLNRYGLTAITGKNGCGKTTLARSLRMLAFADTFEKTASRNIFTTESRIDYSFDGQTYSFSYDSTLENLNSRTPVPSGWQSLFSCELAIPHGERFNFFRSISNADSQIRRDLILGKFTIPFELIDFLHEIYPDKDFGNLVKLQIRKDFYYCIRRPEDRYIREDYFSSGEYFLVSLYRKVLLGYKLIFIDEIDISLDASAQVRLVAQLRLLCAKYRVNIAFTTHSLALMKTLHSGELNLMEATNNLVALRPISYNFVKSILYGFSGWDKYILTEDIVLKEFIEYLINFYCRDIFYQYIVIYIGGSGNVSDLLARNANENFLGESQNVIAILDGDQARFRHARRPNTLCIPILNVEKALFDLYNQANFQPKLSCGRDNEPKVLFDQLLRQKLMSKMQIFEKIRVAFDAELAAFSQTLQQFLT